MLNTIKSFKWFFAIAVISVLLGIFTFIAFLNQGLFFLNEQDLQYLLILDSVVLVIFLVFLVREVSRVFFQYKEKKTGSRTSLNYVLQFSLFTFVPSLLIAVFSLVIFYVGLQQYFDRKISSAVKNSYEVAKNYIQETKKSVEADILLVSVDLNRYSEILYLNTNRFQQIIRSQKLLRRLDEIYLIDSSGNILLADTNNIDSELSIPSEEEFDLALEGKPIPIIGSGENKASVIIKLNNFIDTYLFISRNVQPQVLEYLKDTEQGVNFYYNVKDKRTGIRITFAIIYVIIVSMFLFLTVVLAITFAGRLTRPIINLITASKNISAGKLDSKVPDIDSDEEIKTLNKNFNDMIDRLKKQQDKLLIAERYSAWETVARKLAHEIKNPLTPIKLTLDRIKNNYIKQIDENEKNNFQDNLKIIDNQIKQISNLVNEFSDFARMPKPILKNNNLIQILDENIKLLSEIDLQIKIEFIKNSDQILFRGDKEQLSRVFFNLIKNSIESIQQKAENTSDFSKKITIEINDTGDHISIVIIDNGIGFDIFKKNIKDILNPYFTTKKNGTGLGLSIVNKIINDHNGKIDFISVNNGAKVEINFNLNDS